MAHRVRNQRSGVRGRKSEIGDQMTDGGVADWGFRISECGFGM